MSSGWLGSRRLRFDASHELLRSEAPLGHAWMAPRPDAAIDRLNAAIELTRDHLLAQQQPDGFWVGELEGDTILESEYILLLTFLGQGQTDKARRAANYIVQKQLPEGGWAIYPGGSLEISASVKAYFALKITGYACDAEHMVRARDAILRAGGAERVNSFTRFYLALLGVISYDQCPAVPPELVLVPTWMPLNIYEMSAWSRTIVVPLSLLWAYRPHTTLPPELGIRELFVGAPEDVSVSMQASDARDDMRQGAWIDWRRFFNRVDLALKTLDRLRIRPLRRLAIRRATNWLLERFQDSDGLGAIFPPIVWSVVALKCLGYTDDSPEVQAALTELDKLVISEGDSDRLQPCKSPVWDTALTTIALSDAGVPSEHPALRRAVTWLLSKEVRRPGDWSVLNRGHEPSGWCFEFNNSFYPDVDDTAMVLLAFSRCVPNSRWSADIFVDDWSPHEADEDAAAILAGRTASPSIAYSDIETLQPMLSAMHRGARWLLAMQGRDGGWGAFDPNNNREIFTRVPFADHNAMIDPSTADLTARVLETLGSMNVPADHPAIQRALKFVWREQEPDACWYGRWGVNYIYGTWQTLLGLVKIGIRPSDPRIRNAAEWLKAQQQSGGGWGETPRSYDDPSLRGQGAPTPSQTAWALLGLMAAGEAASAEVERGIEYLIATQSADGTWPEDDFTGTGFPRVFYLKYHLYRVYFPLMALARYRTLICD